LQQFPYILPQAVANDVILNRHVEAFFLRVLDLGCGSGRDLASWGVAAPDVIIGLDMNRPRLLAAKARFPNRTYVRGSGECLPFAEASFDRVLSSVALPYTNIPKTLAEIHRVLAPGGSLWLSLHLPAFTIRELLHNALPKPAAIMFRVYVAGNGLIFHCTGKTVAFPNGRTESFQTERGMRIALNRAGFVNLSFRPVTEVGDSFLVDTFHVERKSRFWSSELLLLSKSEKPRHGSGLMNPP
jgi:SAM-dependent methyltransferase